jgi:hypothetical protein
MQHRIAGPPHRPVARRSAAHAPQAHLYARAVPSPLQAWNRGHVDDAAYLNASPLARLIVRLLLRFF